MPISDEERRVLAESLEQWLEVERSAMLAGMQEQGTSLTKTVRRVFAERKFSFKEEEGKKEGRWSLVKTGDDEIQVSAFSRRHKWLPMRWRGANRSPIAPPTPKPADSITVAGKVIETESDDWFAESMLAEYLSTLPNLADSDPALARTIVSDHLEYLFGDSIPLAEELMCGGILPQGDTVGVPEFGLELRRLDSEELGALLEKWLFGGSRLEKSFLGGSGDSDFSFDFAGDFAENLATLPPELVVASALTLRRSTTKEDAINGPVQIARVVLAIQLLGFTVSGRGVVRKWVERGPNRSNVPEIIVVPEMPEFEERLIGSEELARAYELSRRIPTGFSDPGGREEVALHQFVTGASKMSDAESVIAFMISLEAVLVPDLMSESSYRFRLNGARYLADDPSGRPAIYRDLKKLYQVRSRLVHGGAPPSKDEMRDAKTKARELAARALVKALTNGWPTGADFEEAALL